ncbi:MAG: VanZ family protein [Eubacterium aggregans]|uniref:VanZ family protein n=1 Tax=Eubacterium aggregans TaxID=81409 RepID=UPI002B1EB567|nr:VanZ family protein [Eubacterium aggregans]MEA5072975.1 VanZ family protein [Eubacterium aggregans]
MTRLFSVLTLVWQDVLRDFVLYFPTGVVVAVVVCVGYAIGVTQLNRSKVQPRELAVLFVLAVYVVGVLYITLLSRRAKDLDYYDLSYLFVTVSRSAYSVSQMVENVLLFFPLGCLLPMALPRKWRRSWMVVGVGCLFSIAIELIQLVTHRGACQIFDVMMNTGGTWVGYLCWWVLCSKSCKGFSPKNPRGFL